MTSPLVQKVKTSLLKTTPKTDAGHMYVLKYRDGSTRSFEGAPDMIDRRHSEFCYIVDMSERVTDIRTKVNSRGDAYTYDVTAQVRWRVIDPIEFVRSNAGGISSAAESAIESMVIDAIWRSARDHEPEQAAAAELSSRQAVKNLSAIPMGIAIGWSSVRLDTDPAITAAVIKADDHASGRIEERRGVDHLNQLINSGWDLLKLHIVRTPEDLPKVVQLLADQHAAGNAQAHAMFDKLVANRMIGEDDVEALRQGVVHELTSSLGVAEWLDTPPIGGRRESASRRMIKASPEELREVVTDGGDPADGGLRGWTGVPDLDE